MSHYKVPLEDIKFAFADVLAVNETYDTDVDISFIQSIWDEAAKFSTVELAPLNQSGDEEGCLWDAGEVKTPAGFKAAYTQFVDNGWPGLAQPEAYGGQNLPMSLQFSVYEMLVSANLSWTLYPTITWGAVTTIRTHGTAQQKSDYLPGLVSGKWQGTMCLTEPHSGSDLGLLKTKAVANDDGSYDISGSKIFISSGEHDMVDNVVHITLARIEGAPAGTRGISLFVVPKFLVAEDGSISERNDVRCGSIEHKMGIHGNATCVINFDGAKGFLLGQENKGLANMFTFINESRVDVCLQAQGQIERSFQAALAYSQERLQMKASPRLTADKPADPIIAHPEIRRLLLTQQAFSQGSRLMALDLAKLVDGIHRNDAAAQNKLGFLTPIAKGFITEAAMEATSHGIQIFGGHGFIKEYGVEQYYRDVRITAIYEGTTAIQGIDLITRKIIADECQQFDLFCQEIETLCETTMAQLPLLAHELSAGLKRWRNVTKRLLEDSANDWANTNASAYDYLMLSGYTVMAYYLVLAAKSANDLLQKDTVDLAYDEKFLRSKIELAEFYTARVLPRGLSLEASIAAGSDSIPDYLIGADV